MRRITDALYEEPVLAIEMKDPNTSFSEIISYELELTESQCLEPFPDHLFQLPRPEVYREMFQDHHLPTIAENLMLRIECRRNRPQACGLVPVLNQIAEMDDEEEDEDWEFQKLRRINPDHYLAILSKARLNIQYFQFKGNAHFISPRFLPAICQLIGDY